MSATCSFSPDGKHLSFTNTKPTAIELWVADTATGQSQSRQRRGPPQRDRRRAVRLARRQRDAGLHDRARGARAGAGRTGGARRVRTCTRTTARRRPRRRYEDMLKTKYDEDLFEYYFTSQLAALDTGVRRRRRRSASRRSSRASTPSPDGQYLLVSKVKRPFSHLVPMNGFPQDVEIWSRAGATREEDRGRAVARRHRRSTASRPGRGSTAGAPISRRRWSGSKRSTAANRRTRAVPRPRRRARGAVHRPAGRGREDRMALRRRSFTDKRRRAADRKRSRVAPHAHVDPRRTAARRASCGTASRTRPTRPALRRSPGDRRSTAAARGRRPIMQNGDYIYLAGTGASPQGDRPFLDRLEPQDAEDRALFSSDDETLRDRSSRRSTTTTTTVLTRYETQTDPPNYYVRDVAAGTKRAVTHVQGSAAAAARRPRSSSSPTSARTASTLTGTLYLPPGYKAGHAAAGDHVGVPARVRRRRLRRARSPARRTGSRPITRRLAPVPADAGLRDLRQSDDADHRRRRNGERHLRRSARRRARRRRSTRWSRWASPIAIASASAATATARS